MKKGTAVMTRPIRRRRRRAFTLVELLVVIAIIGVLVALLLPAVQAAREAARRSTCVNNLKQLALGCMNYETARKKMPHGRKFDIWDTYTWTQLVLPYIEQQPIYNLYWKLPDPKHAPQPSPAYGVVGPMGNDERARKARHTRIDTFFCPSDPPPRANEMDTLEWGHWRANYRGCVGGGDMYGTRVDTLDGTVPRGELLGIFGVKEDLDGGPVQLVPSNKLAEIADGTSNTVMLAEGLQPTVPGWGGPIGAYIYGNMGGGLFSNALTPNSTESDRPIGPCPQNQQDTEYYAPCLSLGQHPGQGNRGGAGAHAAARSNHPGGVNAALADASVRFVNEAIDTLAWRWYGSMGRGENPPALD